MKMELEINLGSLAPHDLNNVLTDAYKQHTKRVAARGKPMEDPLEEIGEQGDDDEYEESESEKLSALHAESRGKPADIPVTESDFHNGDIRRSMKKRGIPVPKQKKVKP